jgi:hypothetical protein
LWIAGPDRAAISDASNAIDRMLKNDPQTVGESRGRGVRIVVEEPLAVYFKVSDQDMQATVFAVGRWSSP